MTRCFASYLIRYFTRYLTCYFTGCLTRYVIRYFTRYLTCCFTGYLTHYVIRYFTRYLLRYLTRYFTGHFTRYSTCNLTRYLSRYSSRFFTHYSTCHYTRCRTRSEPKALCGSRQPDSEFCAARTQQKPAGRKSARWHQPGAGHPSSTLESSLAGGQRAAQGKAVGRRPNWAYQRTARAVPGGLQHGLYQ